MSDTTANTKRRHADASTDAMAFAAMLMPFADQWTIAGSLRRELPLVGDVDHVVVPRLEVVGAGGLFGAEPETVNLLWRELDRLLDHKPDAEHEDEFGRTEADGFEPISKAIRETAQGPRTCWGMKQRSVHFRGHTHEIYTTTPEAWGITLLIRTGSADFSRHIVTELQKHGYRANDGRVERRIGGDYAGTSEPRWEPVAVPTERHVFELLGLAYREPNQRNGRW